MTLGELKDEKELSFIWNEVEVIFMKDKDVKELRERLHEEQDKICPVCAQKMSHDAMALDHQHKLFADQPLLDDGAGLVRGAICMGCNSWEGRVTNSFKRMGLHKKDASFSDMLHNLADYLDRENLPYLHPREVPKALKLKKSCYNKLVKVYDKKAKIPDYPKSKKLTKKLKELFEEYKITVEYYSA
jgi:hypothetical protein